MSKLHQIISLSSSFLFITIWHGQSIDILLWSLGNLVMVQAELLYFKVLAKHSVFIRFVCKLRYIKCRIINKNILQINRLSVKNQNNLKCLVLAFWQMVMYVIAFFFLSNFEAAIQIYKKIFIDGKLANKLYNVSLFNVFFLFKIFFVFLLF